MRRSRSVVVPNDARDSSDEQSGKSCSRLIRVAFRVRTTAEANFRTSRDANYGEGGRSRATARYWRWEKIGERGQERSDRR